ncbi:hypothetical protein CY34DRAFT_802105 [Suillus luteus UH-Slu-Lm8-n1]|uniref:DUF6533 domain-containing protein n=1 Tax=Suillus luteus UH-Slu-Lm8-n1 TaxID=930992 RepID=A0A0D0A4M4_9AGAM|nr:hypothetical protein CY34DRAFT_802105 [Suillus luteus UH-Slu-Lm8-n1]
MVLLHTQQTIKAYDYCLTFEHEVRLFSSMSRWNIASVMFILTRYAPIAWLVSDIYVTLGPQSVETVNTIASETCLCHVNAEQQCLATYRTAGSALVLIMLATEGLNPPLRVSGLLLMRTLALWYDNDKVKRFLLSSYLVSDPAILLPVW